MIPVLQIGSIIVGASPGLNEYSTSLDNDSLTIIKALDPLADDPHLSYNKVSLEINGLHIEWYFKLSDNDQEADVKDSDLKNIQKSVDKPEVLFEKNDTNKGEFNSTGYSFSWSDGRPMENRDVTKFIYKMRAEKDSRFLADFPLGKKGKEAPSYTIPGSKYTYYAFDTGLDDPMSDEDNLKSELLKETTELELAHDGKLIIGPGSPSGTYITKIQEALNLVYRGDQSFPQLKETGKFDSQTLAAVQYFQKDKTKALQKGTNGIVGDETIKKLDELIFGSQIPPQTAYTYSWSPDSTETTTATPTITAVNTYPGAVITSEPYQAAPNQQKIKKAVGQTEVYEEQGELARRENTTFLSTVADLSDMDMGELQLPEREKMIIQISTFFYVGADAESTIVRLIKTTAPGQDSKDLLDWLKTSGLLPVLESSVTGDNYKDYQAAMRLLYFNSMSVEEGEEEMSLLNEKMNSGITKSVGAWAKDDHVFFWLSPGIFSQAFSTHMHRIEYSDMEISDPGILSFDIQHTYVLTEAKEHIELDPYEMVMVKFLSSGESLNAKTGDSVMMPAINLLALYNQQWNQEAFATIDIALTFAGGVGLLAKGSKLAKLFGALDFAIGVAALVINDYREKIAETDGGRKFLKVWDTVNGLIAVYGLARVATSIPKIFRELEEGYSEFRTNPSKNLNEDDLKKIDQETSKVIQGSEDVRVEQIRNASRDERINVLAKDPNKANLDLYEGGIGVEAEADYGYFERDPSGAGDFISISGPYKGKSFDAFGLPENVATYPGYDVSTKFFPSIDKHFNKQVDYLILDTRFMNETQRKSVMDYIDENYSNQKSKLFTLPKE